MLKQLRFKFVLINMCIVTLLLFAILGLVFYFTSASLEAESIRMLQGIADSHSSWASPASLPKMSACLFLLYS